MVIVRLIGGLGNQMFQYALGRTLALKLGVPLKLDVSGYREYVLHGYALDRLNIVQDYATDRDLAEVRAPGLLQRAIARVLGTASGNWVRERAFHFDPAVLATRPPAYLEGYWQSEKYFAAASDVIRQEFTLREPMGRANEAMAERISTCNSVALHVRRGDYVDNPTTNAVHGVCGLDYYGAAIAIVAARVREPSLFVFSDDLPWVRDNLRFEFPVTFVDVNGVAQNHLDLSLMASCRHQIIANSSFSWWGAWLNRNPGKVVVAPRRWFNDAERDTRDLIPEGWLRT